MSLYWQFIALQRAYLASPVSLQTAWAGDAGPSFRFRSDVTINPRHDRSPMHTDAENHPVWVRQIRKLHLRHSSQFLDEIIIFNNKRHLQKWSHGQYCWIHLWSCSSTLKFCIYKLILNLMKLQSIYNWKGRRGEEFWGQTVTLLYFCSPHSADGLHKSICHCHITRTIPANGGEDDRAFVHQMTTYSDSRWCSEENMLILSFKIKHLCKICKERIRKIYANCSKEVSKQKMFWKTIMKLNW